MDWISFELAMGPITEKNAKTLFDPKKMELIYKAATACRITEHQLGKINDRFIGEDVKPKLSDYVFEFKRHLMRPDGACEICDGNTWVFPDCITPMAGIPIMRCDCAGGLANHIMHARKNSEAQAEWVKSFFFGITCAEYKANGIQHAIQFYTRAVERAQTEEQRVFFQKRVEFFNSVRA